MNELGCEMARANEANITVLHAKDIRKASQLVSKRSYSWLYLGKDVKQREKISQVLGGDNRYFIGGLLHEVAHQLKQPFLDFVAELGRYQKDKLHWWASNIAYKCPAASDFFLLQCYAAILEKVCSDNRCCGGKTLVVFVEDRWLYRYLWQRYKREARGLCFLSRKSVLPAILKSAIRAIMSRGYFLLKTGRQIWNSRTVAGQSKLSDLIRNEKEIYIYSWIQDRSFPKDGEFQDAYFGRLQEIVNDCGLNVTYITPPFLESDLKRKCLDYGNCKFIFLDQYINLGSILKSLFSLPRISFPEELDSQFPSLKILLQREIMREFSSLPRYILQYFTFKECLKGIRQRKITIIYPFENQPWEKMLCLAAKELDKNIKLVGYQHYPVPLLLLNCFLGTGESSTMPLPDLIVTNGEYTLNLLKNAGYGEVELVNGGALRYEYLHDKVGKVQ